MVVTTLRIGVLDPKRLDGLAQLRGPAIVGRLFPQFRTMANRSAQARLTGSNADAAQFTGNERYLCGTVPNGRSKVSQTRLSGGDRSSQSLLERVDGFGSLILEGSNTRLVIYSAGRKGQSIHSVALSAWRRVPTVAAFAA